MRLPFAFVAILACAISCSFSNAQESSQQKEIEALKAEMKEQASKIQKVSAQLELNKPAPQTVKNNQ